MLQDLPVPGDKKLCIVGRKAQTLDKDDFEILQAALANPNWSTNGLAIELTKRGFETTEGALRKHRMESCSCAR
jgi:hypothetical protein